MRRIDVEKKRAFRWPWLLGVVLLALLAWGATALLRSPEEPEGLELPPTAADTLPPARIPSLGPGAATAPATPSVADLLPLSEEHLGETVLADGEVLATGNDAFWILAESTLLRVDSARRIRKGDTVNVRGVLRESDPAMTDEIASDVLSRSPGSDSWTVVRSFKLVDEEAAGTASADSGVGAT